MALTSTLGSPGIEIREVDNSIRLNSSTATTMYVPGFAAQGPVDEVMPIGTIADFELIYGVPTNAAERYFYYTVKAILDNSGNGATVLCSRMPYGEKAGDTVSNAYTMLVYPAVPVIKKKNYKKYSCLTEYKDKDTGEEFYIIKFNIDKTTVTYRCSKNVDADISTNWTLYKENTSNESENTSDYKYDFYFLEDEDYDNKGYKLVSSSGEVSTVLNSVIYCDFDQFIICKENDFKSLFSTLSLTNENKTTEDFECEIQDFCMTLDDNYVDEILKIGLDLNIISFNADKAAKAIPLVSGMISDEKSGW